MSGLTTMCTEFEECLLQQYDDTTIVHYILESKPSQASSRVFFLSPNLVAKQYSRGEEEAAISAMECAGQLKIRVPSIHRVVKRNDDIYVISERVRGRTLEDAWIHLSWLRTLLLAFQLRRYIRRMRSLSSTTAGSLFDGMCRSVWLDDYYGLPPHASPEAITDFNQFWLNFVPPSQRKNKKSSNMTFASKHHSPLIFTHQDLAPRNIIVDEKSRIWLLDWDCSGWYPRYFEYVSMQNFHTPSSWGWLDKLRWKLFSWISVGLFSKEQGELELTRMRFTRYPLGRKNEVLQEGAPAHAAHLRKPGM